MSTVAKLCLCWLLIAYTGVAHAGLQLPSLFQEHMVLQQKSGVAVWGWGTPGDTVTVTADWQKSILAKVMADSSWHAILYTPAADKAQHKLSVTDGHTTVHIGDILLGEVWFCCGQSNMNFPLAKMGGWRSGVVDYENVIAAAAHPDIHFFTVARQTSAMVVKDCRGSWKVCSKATADSFSAVAYYFAVELQSRLHVPVGIIHSSWGGTPIQSWMKKEVFATDTAFDAIRVRASKEVPDTTSADAANINSRKASYLYNAMVAPVIPYTVKGMLWYQGENNAKEPALYSKLFPAFIQSLRREWGYELPFYFVQIAPYKGSTPGIRQAQLQTYRSVPHTGMAVITDVGDSADIHPRNKEVPGKRLAYWAVAQTYGQRLDYSGPLYRSVAFRKGMAAIKWDFAEGLYAPSGSLNDFAIAGADRRFYPAQARIAGNKVLVWSDKVKEPQFVRYGWRPAPVADLFNKAGFPASSFSTGGEW